jgi:hypothetical protein
MLEEEDDVRQWRFASSLFADAEAMRRYRRA